MNNILPNIIILEDLLIWYESPILVYIPDISTNIRKIAV